MLMKGEVLRRIAAKQIDVSYEFDLSKTPPVRLKPEQRVNPAEPSSFATTAFNANFWGDRLGLTLGPVVLSHQYRKRRGRVLFKNRKGYFDLRASDNSIAIMPGEAMTVSTVERVSLGGGVGALVLPRLTLATAGLVVATTYIDPMWDGILQLEIKNNAGAPLQIDFGEKIAVCRFYDITGTPLGADDRAAFARKSHHYGLNWAKILDTDYDAQPLRKTPVISRSFWEVLCSVGPYFRDRILGAGLAALLITMSITGLIAYGRLQERLNRFDKAEQDLRDVSELRQRLRDVETKLPAGGEAEIAIPRDEREAIESISVPRSVADGRIVSIEVIPAGTAEITRQDFRIDPSKQGGAILTVGLKRINQNNKARLPLTLRWLVVSQ